MDPRTPRTRTFPGEAPPPAPKRPAAPDLDLRVVEWLERMYPEISPLPGARNEDLWFAHGARRVVKQLRAEYNAQKERE